MKLFLTRGEYDLENEVSSRKEDKIYKYT